jgi:hypothetical protein
LVTNAATQISARIGDDAYRFDRIGNLGNGKLGKK